MQQPERLFLCPCAHSLSPKRALKSSPILLGSRHVCLFGWESSRAIDYLQINLGWQLCSP